MSHEHLVDPDREERTHVINVRFSGRVWMVQLSDRSEVEWDVWFSMSHEERRRQ